jgi:type III restriction enzyme
MSAPPSSTPSVMRIQRKEFQEQALLTLTRFLESSRNSGPASAFRFETGSPYNEKPFGQHVPCVCLRIPTGGGKTILGARAIPLIAPHYGGADAPVVVWIVPSDAILVQTLNALKTDGHPYREQLFAHYGDRLIVGELGDVSNIPVGQWGQCAIVIVTTLQSFNVEKTNIRRVYSFAEPFETHFKSKTEEDLRVLQNVDSALVTTDDFDELDLVKRELLISHLGKPKWSLANWLALQSPILIVDEAHNAKTDKSFVTLTRLNPSAVLELTATPIPGKINVLYHVSAMQLQAESMIKMPIMLVEHKEDWEKAVLGAVHTRGALADASIKEQANGKGYIRPIVLFQATNEGGKVPPEKLREYLQTELKIAPEEIAVATGTTRELTDIDLSSPACRILYIITVQALREGWDCPFAYVLCSLQNLSSATAVEQLLGRVLRMPYASQRGEHVLNRAYAHVCEANTGYAAKALADRLIDNMGFDPLDVAAMLATQIESPQTGFNGDDWEAQAFAREQAIITPLGVPLTNTVDLPICVELRPDSTGKTVPVLRGYVDEVAVEKIIAATVGKKAKEQITEDIVRHNAITLASSSPANLGLPFAKLPRLSFRDSPQGELQLLEREVILEEVELDLLSVDAIDIGRFDLASEPDAYEISMSSDDGHVVYQRADASQIPINYGATQLTPSDIARWLDQALYQKAAYLSQVQRLAYFSAVVENLVNVHRYSVGQIGEARYLLAKKLISKIEDLRNKTCKNLFKQAVLDEAWITEADWQNPFEYKFYPATAGSRYSGRFRFKKNHFGAVIADLKSDGEEFDCLSEIDKHPNVKQWIRNLDFAPGFWLPTSRGKFFPDFIVELFDGTAVVIEYKGQHLRSDAYEIEKRTVGLLWAKKATQRCRFEFVFKNGDRGEAMAEQLSKLLA